MKIRSVLLLVGLFFSVLVPGGVNAQVVIDGAGLNVNGASVSTDGRLMIDDVIHNTIPADLWIGDFDGYLLSCDNSGGCINHGDKGTGAFSMTVFNGKLWIAQNDGTLQSCDGSGGCAYVGDKGYPINSMVLFDGKLWIGQNEGILQSCDSSGICTNHGDKGNHILDMAVFNGKLWIGQTGGTLQSCNSAGSCTDHGDKGWSIYSMRVFNGELWIGQDDGKLQSCDGSGVCNDHGVKGLTIWSMAVFNGKLWIGDNDGILQSCDSSGVCTNHGDKGNSIGSMAVFNSNLWIGDSEGVLQSCASGGNCASHGDLGNALLSMAAFHPAGLGNTLHVTSGVVGVNNTNPDVALDVIGSIEYTGIITDVSDDRLKENLRPIDGALSKIQAIDGVYFNMIETPQQTEIGVTAQNVQKVLPEAVKVIDKKNGYLGVSYPSLIPVLIEALKEQQKEIEDLKRMIFEMKKPME